MAKGESSTRAGGSRRGRKSGGSSGSTESTSGTRKRSKQMGKACSKRSGRESSEVPARAEDTVVERLHAALGPGVGNNRQVLSGFLTLWDTMSMELVASANKNPFAGITQHLSFLHIDLNKAGTIRWTELSTILESQLPRLEGAELTGRDLGPSEVREFGWLVGQSTRLARVHVHASRSVQHEAIVALSESLARRHSTLQEVSLRGDVCCQADHSLICLNTLFDAPPVNLRVLELSNGNLGFAGASSVARALKDHRLTGLTELRLHKGGLWANGFREICQALSDATTAPRLEVLDLRDNWGIDLKQLADAALPALHTLRLSGCVTSALSEPAARLLRALLDSDPPLLPSLQHLDLLDDAVLHVGSSRDAKALLEAVVEGWSCSRLPFPSQALSLVDGYDATQQGDGSAVPVAPLLSTVLSSLLSHPAALHPPRRLTISSSTGPLQPSLPALTRLLRLHPPTLRSLSLDAVMSSADLLGLLQPQLFPHLHDLALTFAQGSSVSRTDLRALLSPLLLCSSTTSIAFVWAEPAVASAASSSSRRPKGGVAVLSSGTSLPPRLHTLILDGFCTKSDVCNARDVIRRASRRGCCGLKKLHLSGRGVDLATCARTTDELPCTISDRRISSTPIQPFLGA